MKHLSIVSALLGLSLVLPLRAAHAAAGDPATAVPRDTLVYVELSREAVQRLTSMAAIPPATGIFVPSVQSPFSYANQALNLPEKAVENAAPHLQAAAFHNGLESKLRAESRALLSNLRGISTAYNPDQIWNHAIWKYEATYVQPASDLDLVTITVNAWANMDKYPSNDTEDRPLQYVYAIYYDEGSAIDTVANDWISAGGENWQSPYPPKSLMVVYPPPEGWVSPNPALTESRVRELDAAN